MYVECSNPDPQPLVAVRDERRALRYRVRFDDADAALIRLDGDLDRAGAAHLAEALEACATVGISTFEIDAACVTFADSRGVQLLAEHAAIVRHRGGSLRVVRQSQHVCRALELTALTAPLTGNLGAAAVAGRITS